MPHTIITNICEGIGDCLNACPVGCINYADRINQKGKNYCIINFDTCIDCGVCQQVCPIDGAVIAEERPDLQIS